MSKINRTPRARTELSADMLAAIAATLDKEIVSEIRRLSAKLREKGVQKVAVTGMLNLDKARANLIGWVASVESTINKATISLDDLAKQNAAQIAEQALEKDAKRKSRK